MLKRKQVLFGPFKAAAESYREYLKFSDAELPSLESLLFGHKQSSPGKPSGLNSTECIEFHKELCHAMSEDGHHFIGVRVLPFTYEGIQCFRDNNNNNGSNGCICMPLFSCLTGRGTCDITKHRIQHVEGALCMRIGEHSHAVDDPYSLFRGSLCSVALEVVGTRFPFYAPSTAALACDLGGLISFFKAPVDHPIQKIGEENLVNHHFVLTHNGEPVQIGCGKLCHGSGSPLGALKEAVKYAKLLGRPLERDHLVICGGACPRFPAQRGNYSINWGLFGNVSCSLK